MRIVMLEGVSWEWKEAEGDIQADLRKYHIALNFTQSSEQNCTTHLPFKYLRFHAAH